MKRKDVLIFLVPTVTIVILWVIFNIYHNFITSTIPSEVNMQILFINPDFNLKTIEELKKRDAVEPSYTFEPTKDQQGQEVEPLNPTPTVTEIEESSASAQSTGGEIST